MKEQAELSVMTSVELDVLSFADLVGGRGYIVGAADRLRVVLKIDPRSEKDSRVAIYSELRREADVINPNFEVKDRSGAEIKKEAILRSKGSVFNPQPKK